MKAALLLSGGMDSLSLAWWKRPFVALTIDYGQAAAAAEIASATAICRRLEIPHHILSVDCRSLGSGDMAGTEASRYAPATDWWPYRNQLLLTLAAMKAISLGATCLQIGTVKSDGTHRDGTGEFMELLSSLLEMQEGGLTLVAPALNLSTVELIREAKVPESLLAWAHSCHRSNVVCGSCRGCNKFFDVREALRYELG